MIARPLIVALVCCFALTGRAEQDASESTQISMISWLLGNWQQEREETIRTESWETVAPGIYRGLGQSLLKEDGSVRFSEALLLYEASGSVIYLASVPENKLPVPFGMVSASSKHAVFENLSHDFPKRLDYRLMSWCELQVRVSDAGDEGFTLTFARISADCSSELESKP
ncbi:MAG: DUF6265 family protein [Pseudomonadota bacterium]